MLDHHGKEETKASLVPKNVGAIVTGWDVEFPLGRVPLTHRMRLRLQGGGCKLGQGEGPHAQTTSEPLWGTAQSPHFPRTQPWSAPNSRWTSSAPPYPKVKETFPLALCYIIAQKKKCPKFRYKENTLTLGKTL